MSKQLCVWSLEQSLQIKGELTSYEALDIYKQQEYLISDVDKYIAGGQFSYSEVYILGQLKQRLFRELNAIKEDFKL